MFLKDEYIVLLDTPIDDDCYPPNYIFKQDEDSNQLSTYKDIIGDSNGWSSVKKSSTEVSRFNWRYAYDYEIEAYDEEDKPVCILDLKKIIKVYNYEYLIELFKNIV